MSNILSRDISISYHGTTGYSQYKFSIFIGFFDHGSYFTACLALDNYLIPYKSDKNEIFRFGLDALSQLNRFTARKQEHEIKEIHFVRDV